MSTASANARHANALVHALLDGGVRHAVVSPGARNTPLVMALHAQRERVVLHSILDERSAAFVALGLARASGSPVLLSCTSGTAGAHWLPALIEASESGLPLVAVTADRPTELHDCGAPQTIDQTRLFGTHVRAFFDLGEPASEVTPRWLAGIAAQALDAATGARPGPVHLNARFRKPLWEPGLESVVHLDGPAVTPKIVRETPRVSAATLGSIADELASVERGVIVCGVRDGAHVLRDREFAPAVARLARRLGWPILAEPSSQLRFGPHDRELVVQGVDALMRTPEAGASLRPSRVLRFGRSPVSKALSGWLERYAAGQVIAVDESGAWRDAERSMGQLLVADPVDFSDRLAAALPARDSAWCRAWLELSEKALESMAAVTAEPGWAGHAANAVVGALPDGSLLHVASSMPVRDLDGFGLPTDKKISVSSNRGANGIDGTLSTALGQALAWENGPVAVLLGDLAFLHDAGALRTLSSASVPFAVVVVDNGGGGIFDYLPISENEDVFEPWFLTPQKADFAALTEASGVSYVACPKGDSLVECLENVLAEPGPHVVHVQIDRGEDRDRHEQFWQMVSQQIAPWIESRG